MDTATTANLAAGIAAIGICVDSAEWVVNQETNDAWLDWSVIRTRYPERLPRGIIVLLDWFALPHVTRLLVITRAIAAVLVALLFRFTFLAAPLAAITLVVHLLLHLRFVYGFDGSDQMQTVVWASVLVVVATGPSSVAAEAAVIFLAAQALLSYATSGIAKVVSPIWRSGRAVEQILLTSSYGSRRIGHLVRRYRISAPLSWGTVAFEVFGPLLLLTGWDGAAAFVTIGVAFHVGIALAMGLNTFVWAFAASYPAVLYVSRWTEILR